MQVYETRIGSVTNFLLNLRDIALDEPEGVHRLKAAVVVHGAITDREFLTFRIIFVRLKA